MRKDLRGAVEHLTLAISKYPHFVAAHNAPGTAYLQLGQYDLAGDQFAQAVLLDDHLPSSYLNLGSAQLALKDYRSAEGSLEKASSIAPLDLQLATALAYTQLMNQDYGAVLATAHRVHSRKHEGAAMVHYFAAEAWQDQNNLQGTQDELETFLREDPTVGNGGEQTLGGDADLVGTHALRVLADRSGGAAFVPNSLRGLDHGLDEVQQVLRSRYLISYRPALFKDDGQYRAIDISARKSGHKLRVYPRRGYYARVNSSGEENF